MKFVEPRNVERISKMVLPAPSLKVGT